ncbi:MAG: class I SAM-dependent methyltransferase [Sedimentisphaerales bacterium]|nr:class I SAM-dependent methyltransferase [Sedimentisphaerales bacterium]
MFEEMEKINARPKPFEYYTAGDLWTDKHTSKMMLSYHLNTDVDISSRNEKFINRSVDWITAQFGVKSGTKIADFGCGPGLYTAKLARKQADVTGIDFSKRSIQYAKQAAQKDGLSIRYENKNYLEFETKERFNLVLMIMCDFCALSPSQRAKILNIFREILEPGGSILLDVYSLTAFEKRKETAIYEENLLDSFWSPNKYYGFLNTFKYEKEKVVLDKYTIIEAARTWVVYNWLQYFSTETLEAEFTECGFTIEKLYSDVAGSPYSPETEEFAVVAKRA